MDRMWSGRKRNQVHSLWLKLCVVGALFVSVSMMSVASAVSNSPPNILMILTDDQGWGDVGAYGAQDLRTPAMDSLINSKLQQIALGMGSFGLKCCFFF